MYAPKGPVCDPNDIETIKFFIDRIKEEGIKNGSIFLRMDPNIVEPTSIDTINALIQEGFIHLDHRWSFWNSPRDVYRIDLTKFNTEEELFMSMDRDTRRCVRKSAKEGVSIRPARNIDELKRFTIYLNDSQ